MSNNLGTANGALIAQTALPLLIAKYPILKSFCTDFSAEPIKLNQTLITRIPTVGTLQSYDTTNGYVPSDATLTDVSVSINQHVHTTFALTDAELSSTQNANLLNTLANTFADTLGLGIMTGVAALFTTGNYNNTPTVQALTGVNRNTVIAANIALSKRNVSKDRFGIVNADFYGQLKQDPYLINMFFGGLGVSPVGLPVVDGVQISEFTALPTTSNLQGVIGAKDAIVIAARTPSDAGYQDIPLPGRIDVVTDPDSGLSVQVREFYDIGKGRRQVTFTLIYGVGVGNAKALQLVTTA